MEMNETAALTEIARCSKAAVLLQLQAQQASEERAKPEVLLARAGFIAREIAQMLGKSESAISKSIQRAGKAA